MKRLPVDFSKTDSFSPIFLDYISGKDSLTSYYKYSPDISSFKKVIEDKSKEATNRKTLVEVLKEQNSKLQTSNTKQAEAIDSLLSEKTFTVTTGHQLCIFTGPLFSIYKILTVIKLAQELKKSYSVYNFVPVFWMVTEDHDFEEINSVNISGRRIEWNPGVSQSLKGKVPTGRLSCEGIKKLTDELKEMLGESENTDYLLTLFRMAYNEKNNLADATRIIIHELFGKYGLVVLDASDKRLKKYFTDVMKEELLQGSSFKYVNETISQLESHYKAQVNPREINLFYLNDQGRNRIVKDANGNYAILNANMKFSQAEIITELEHHPERFSPNVVLRPLYQEKILPNLAYVGGPGEISYWLEYKRMFEHFKVNYPVIVSRSCVMWLDESSASKMEKLAVTPEQIFSETESLVKVFLEKNFDHTYSLSDEAAQIEKLFVSLSEKVGQVDVTLKSTVDAEKQKQLNGLKTIEEKIIRAQKKKHEIFINQLRKLKEKLFPEGILQERYENFIPYYIKYGDKYFDMLLDNFDAVPKKFLILSEREK